MAAYRGYTNKNVCLVAKSGNYPHLSIFLPSYLYLPLNWKSLKLLYQVTGYNTQKVTYSWTDYRFIVQGTLRFCLHTLLVTDRLSD